MAVVRVGASAYDERREDTATKIVVTREELLRYGESTLPDALKRLPGITLGGVQGRGGAVRMRGLGGAYTQILLNGEAMPQGFTLDAIAPDLVERVEILRSATADMSTQGIAGTINIVLRKVVSAAQREVKLTEGRQNGKDETTVGGRVGDKRGPLSYSVGASIAQGRFDYPSYRTESGSNADGGAALARFTREDNNGRSRNLQLTPRATLALPGGDVLSLQTLLNLRHFQGNDNEFSNAAIGPVPGETDFTDFSRTRNQNLRNTLDWTHKLAHGAQLQLKLGSDYGHRDVDTVWRQDQGAGDFIGNRWTRSRYSDIATTTRGKYLRLVAGSHLLSAGWDGTDARRLEAHSDRTDDTVTPAPVTALQDFHANVRRLALFAQDEWSRSASLSLYLGVRWETLSTRSHGSGFDAVSDRFDVLSPILQVLWKLPDSKNDQLRFALARTYKAPDANSLPPRRYIADNNSATNPDSIGNPHLRPELSTGVDGAFEHFLAGGGTLSASVYVRRIRDVTVTRINNIDGRWVAMLSNLGQADTHGIELEAKFPLKTFYKAAPAIDFRSNIAFNWSRLSGVPGPYNRLDAQTPVSGSVGIDYKPDRVPLAVGASFTFQKGGPVRISPVQINTAAFKRVLDVYALWTIDPKLSWRLSASNILQQDNISGKLYTDADGSRSQTTMAPTMVQWRLVLEKKF